MDGFLVQNYELSFSISVDQMVLEKYNIIDIPTYFTRQNWIVPEVYHFLLHIADIALYVLYCAYKQI